MFAKIGLMLGDDSGGYHIRGYQLAVLIHQLGGHFAASVHAGGLNLGLPHRNGGIQRKLPHVHIFQSGCRLG